MVGDVVAAVDSVVVIGVADQAAVLAVEAVAVVADLVEVVGVAGKYFIILGH